MPSRSGAEETLAPPTEQQANAPVATAMDAKLMLATANGDVQQLKDLVNKQEQDSKMMVVVMAKQLATAASAEKPQQGNMNPRLLALASSGSSEELKSLLCREDSQVFGSGLDGSLLNQQASDNTAEERQACANGVEGSGASPDGVEGSLPMRQASGDVVEVNGITITGEGHTASVCASSSEKTQTLVNGTDGSLHMGQASNEIVEENESILEGVVAKGHTGLVCGGSSEKLRALRNPEEGQACANGTDGSMHMRGACDDIEANELILEGVTAQGDTALHVVAACGQGNNFLESARIIYGKANHLLFEQNNNGDTPLHCAARAGKSKMVACLIDLALAEGEGTRVMKELLRKENKHKETALNEAVRVGNMDIVDLLMEKDSELASFPRDGSAASPMYLAIVLKQDEIVKTLYDKSNHAMLSFSGPNGQNALHAAVLRYRARGLTKLLKWNEEHLCLQNKDLTTERDENGSTPLHFAASFKFWIPFGPSNICRQVLEANPDALYQPDHAGFFPIHVAASVGAFRNVNMFVEKCPGSAGLRDAKGMTFLHVAVEEKKANVIRSACKNLSLSWIMNMVDNDGNTALHLAVKAGSLRMFSPLLANPQVNLNLPNSKGETPLDIAQYKLSGKGLCYIQSSEAQIVNTLQFAGAVKGVSRHDPLGNNTTARVKHDESKETEVLKDSTGTLCIGSVLIATVTFGATFAAPGGYIADDHNNGGTPILARRYAFDAFIASNTLAFVLSGMATISLMQSGSALFNTLSRKIHLTAAFYLLSISLTCLATAFALGAYVVLAPVSHKTAIATCVLTTLLPLYGMAEYLWRHLLLLLPPIWTRKGLWIAMLYPGGLMGAMLVANWPLLIIFAWATYANLAPTLQAPAPSPVA